MPMYEYVCKSCTHSLEKLQKIDAEPIIFCPACESNTLEKKISAAGFRLKGSGWYETDFKKKDQRNLASNDDKKTTEEKSVTSTAKDKGKES
ncbi:MAG: zinc ribbon domain-containing protein [Francisellaceae bacterium]|jgi:putative FmdB family regulatory protein|nr:zinc ribbon domain-containing protein [Francisellaceae bacterium]MBT6206574.1 zinc ribbon domain-containing protein [Francisellaceae bacterium]MBT6538637.1 zinc ribbon domain-containing protein [Francisellaceae bacterium]